MSIIYRITCIETQKFYIGSTMNKTQRWAKHRKELRAGTHVNKHLQASWTKYGEAAFTFEVIEEVQDPTLLFVVEQRYLDKVVGQPDCFNWSKYAGAPMRGKFGADNPKTGTSVPQDVRDKISAGLSGEKHPNWGKKLAPETVAKIVEANKTNPWKGAKHTPESLEKIAAASRGRPVSEETRAKRSIALKGREISTAQRMQISRTLSGEGNFWYGKQRSDEFKQKIRKAIVATDAEGVQTEYPSIKTMREVLGMTPTTVNRALKAGAPILNGKFRGWSFKYLEPAATS